MGRKSKCTIEQKIEAVLDYKSGKSGTCQICKDLGLTQSGVTLYKWIHIYEDFGETGFLPKQKKQIIL